VAQNPARLTSRSFSPFSLSLSLPLEDRRARADAGRQQARETLRVMPGMSLGAEPAARGAATTKGGCNRRLYTRIIHDKYLRALARLARLAQKRSGSAKRRRYCHSRDTARPNAIFSLSADRESDIDERILQTLLFAIDCRNNAAASKRSTIFVPSGEGTLKVRRAQACPSNWHASRIIPVGASDGARTATAIKMPLAEFRFCFFSCVQFSFALAVVL
jgi:hypothetical protein